MSDPVENTPLHWLAPGHRASPAEALARIEQICGLCPDLFSAAFVVAATHQGVKADRLAAALRQFRPDAQALSASDVTSLIVAMVNGGREAFEAVLRTRKKAQRSVTAALPWAQNE
jgi:anthranilate phosphoribosyltransferase